jgi:hypothetical protein
VFDFDILRVESVANRLHEIAVSERITSNEAQWIVQANTILEQLRVDLIRRSVQGE